MLTSSIRIVTGHFKGRKIPTLQGQGIRPTSLRSREALFSILGSSIAGATVADLFAGSGSIGLEALSRGAAKAVFVEQHSEAGQTIEKTLRQFNVATKSRVLIQDVALAMKNPLLVGWQPFDVLYFDPPYRFEHSLDLLMQIANAELVAQTGHIIYEHFAKMTPPSSLGPWVLTRTTKYGETALTFYRHESHNNLASQTQA
ncbi:MAG: 16S rRNA (guanine(966)-N(2))-methyltransferase RsmD [Nitrospirota bacterium]|nr:16S rRNA (guanine(966)-N(2))-methyltransferase RsmD [Nitrospirota bacterium]